MADQLTMFDVQENYKVNKPIRLIELLGIDYKAKIQNWRY